MTPEPRPPVFVAIDLAGGCETSCFWRALPGGRFEVVHMLQLYRLDYYRAKRDAERKGPKP